VALVPAEEYVALVSQHISLDVVIDSLRIKFIIFIQISILILIHFNQTTVVALLLMVYWELALQATNVLLLAELQVDRAAAAAQALVASVSCGFTK